MSMPSRVSPMGSARPLRCRGFLALLGLLIVGCQPVGDGAKLYRLANRADPRAVLDQVAKALGRYDEQVKLIEILYFPLEAQSEVYLDRDRLVDEATFKILIRPEYPPPSLAEAIRASQVNVKGSRDVGDLRWRFRVVLRGDDRPVDIYANYAGKAGYVLDVPVTFSQGGLPEWLRHATAGLNVPTKGHR